MRRNGRLLPGRSFAERALNAFVATQTEALAPSPQERAAVRARVERRVREAVAELAAGGSAGSAEVIPDD